MLLNKTSMTSSTSKYVTTEYGKQNMFAASPEPWIDESQEYKGYASNAELTNSRWAMIGFVAAIGAYVTTGQIIPGIF
tara:strand:+ start:308 stop:541 length:234 start_codon:yes stop_codon:yes gene_type:complete